MFTKVQKTIKQHNLIHTGDRILVALSGGADSVCLLDCLQKLSDELGISLSVAHVHHGLRGQDADDDELFVQRLCGERDIPLYVKRVDVRALAAETKTGLEEAGRNARYTFFKELKEEYGFDKVATAHHSGDNIETVLMRLMRGTGPLGLGGIPYVNQNIIRPLLDVSRQEIEDYCKAQNLSFRTDLSNFETNYTRNKVRHELIPLIEEKFNPEFKNSFGEQIRLYASCGAYIKDEAEKLMQKEMHSALHGVCFSCQSLLTYNEFLLSTMLHEVLQQHAGGHSITANHINSIMAMLRQEKCSVSLPDDMIAEVCHGWLYIRRNIPVKAFSYSLTESCFIKEIGQYVTVCDATCIPNKGNVCTAYFDKKKLNGKKLMLRSRCDGDAFYPVGMDGRKKLHDFFVDKKVPYFLRNTVPILTADDEIVWIAGYRADRRFIATKDTDAIVCVKIHKGEQ